METKRLCLPARTVVVLLSLGALAAVASQGLLSDLWQGLDWPWPVREWLAGLGCTVGTGWLRVFWTKLPTFVVAGLLGVGLGRRFSERWLPAACWCALGFAGVLSGLRTWVWGPKLPFTDGWRTAIKVEAWLVAPVTLMLLAAWDSARRQARCVPPPKPPADRSRPG